MTPVHVSFLILLMMAPISAFVDDDSAALFMGIFLGKRECLDWGAVLACALDHKFNGRNGDEDALSEC